MRKLSGARKVGGRGISRVLPGQEHAGYQPPIKADDCLGYSRTGESSEAALTSRDVDGCALVRLVGHLPKGRTGKKKGKLAQKAKVGYGASRAAVTHVAPPPTLALEVGNSLKAQGMRLWKKIGLLECRRWAVRKRQRANGSLPYGWSRAAPSLVMHAPDPF